ncbi:MAG: sigma-70 family RNA polymerase sigma factor [Gracilibacteraceae bacterium]|jgi:RNA polymerase sigma-70 factor (ECF subfamily)|nr:sigma-70 family RNA polymerase sigma factor [Gracilibacteraceae bacterium]
MSYTDTITNPNGAPVQEDFPTILGRYQDLVYRIALTHTGTLHDAQDVFQEVFLIYWRKKPLLHDEEHRQAWLITTARNCAKQITSGSWHRRVVLVDEPPQPLQPDKEAFHFETAEQNEVFAALQKLPAKYRTVLHLFYFEDMSVAQIAAALQIAAGTVKVQLTRGRQLMREELKGAYFYE